MVCGGMVEVVFEVGCWYW